MTSIAALNLLLEKTSDWDKDERYMATNDLCTALSKDIKIDENMEQRICAAVLKQLGMLYLRYFIAPDISLSFHNVIPSRRSVERRAVSCSQVSCNHHKEGPASADRRCLQEALLSHLGRQGCSQRRLLDWFEDADRGCS